MKSPVKRNWKVFVAWTVVGIVLAILIVLGKLFFHQSFDPLQIIMLLSLEAIFIVMGLNKSGSNNLLHRRVIYPVEPIKLVKGEFYWLSGKYTVIYRGQDAYTGKYKFDLYTPDHKEIMLFPGEVRLYISTEKEIS